MTECAISKVSKAIEISK
jgi:hypothetical protein